MRIVQLLRTTASPKIRVETMAPAQALWPNTNARAQQVSLEKIARLLFSLIHVTRIIVRKMEPINARVILMTKQHTSASVEKGTQVRYFSYQIVDAFIL